MTMSEQEHVTPEKCRQLADEVERYAREGVDVESYHVLRRAAATIEELERMAADARQSEMVQSKLLEDALSEARPASTDTDDARYHCLMAEKAIRRPFSDHEADDTYWCRTVRQLADALDAARAAADVAWHPASEEPADGGKYCVAFVRPDGNRGIRNVTRLGPAWVYGFGDICGGSGDPYDRIVIAWAERPVDPPFPTHLLKGGDRG